ncbi:hypothetical protein Tco_1173241 [Tanacetum coccineum]
MADLQFVDQHNMVACLERSDENVEFHQIVDFLTTSSIHYALTVSPTIYASYIEQFWATAKSKTVNDVKQIHATVDGKTVVISESSVRSDLHFNDEDGITCLSNDEIFVNLALMGGPPKKVGDEAVYTGEDDRVVRVATIASSLETEQESGSGPRCQDTTLGGADAQTWFETASKKSHDPPLSEGNTSGSGEDSMEHQVDLMDFVPPTPHDSPLSGGHTPGSNEDCSRPGDPTAKKRVKRLEKALRARTLGMKLFKIGTSKRKGLDKKNVSKQGRKSDKTKPMFNDSDFDVLDDAMENVEGGSTAKQITTIGDILNTASISISTAGPLNVCTAGPSNVSAAGDIFEDEMTTIANTLVAIRSARPRTTSVMIRNVEKEPRRAIPKNKHSLRKSKRLLGKKLQKKEAKDTALIEQIEDVQARMDVDELVAERIQQEEREQFTVDEQARMLIDLIAKRKKFFAT